MCLFFLLIFPESGDISPTFDLVPDDDRPVITGRSQVLSRRAPPDDVHCARMSLERGRIDRTRRMRSDLQARGGIDVWTVSHVWVDGPDPNATISPSGRQPVDSRSRSIEPSCRGRHVRRVLSRSRGDIPCGPGDGDGTGSDSCTAPSRSRRGLISSVVVACEGRRSYGS